MRTSQWQWHLDEVFVKINGTRQVEGDRGGQSAGSRLLVEQPGWELALTFWKDPSVFQSGRQFAA